MSAKNFTYTLQIDAEIKNLLAKTEQVKKNMAGITANGKMPEMEKQFLAIERSLTKLQEKAATPITSAAAFGSMQKDVAATKVAIEGLSGSVTKLQTASTGEKLQFIDPNMLKTIQAADVALDAFGVATSEASKKTTDLVTAEKLLAVANREVEKAQNGVNRSQEKVDVAKGRVEAAKQEADAIKKKIEILKKWQATQKAYDTPDEKGNKPDKRSAISPEVNYRKDKSAAQGLGIDISTPEKLNEAIQTLNASLTTQESEVGRLNAAYNAADRTLKNHQDKLTDATTASTRAQQAFDKLNAEFEQNKAKNSQVAFDTLRASVEKLGIDLSDIPTQYTEQNLEALRAKCDQLKNQGIQDVDTSLGGLETSLRETGEAAEATSDKISESSGEFKKLDDQAGQTQAFASRIKQFVGIQGAAMVARRALRDAFNAIKELDAAMTEMSVVTDTDISGYWDQLPEYTERANELGLTIKDVYQADTLFYQQGLKTNEVIELSTQTMKMARVAGLDTAEATDRMTAALRGFNMELNETNAQKIADVYSKLAAITASDVDEISSAMTKTASIASNAGMEFETTAAFLSQIIETTRESAETAGTAMKTVIARFQELKKDPAEIGEVDGEVIDANKIETALRSVGVALRDTNGQFRELDAVFLELASKWDSLDTNTQRYIATIAAGSRQQSRFIAMMSDYGRTQELVSAANASAGASNEQFEKTMESLSAKLNKLQNAWNSFTMSIMDNDLLKAGVDMLTKLLTVVNEFTDSLGQFSGAAKIMLLVTALYLGDKALKAFLVSFGKSKSVLGSFGAAAKGTFTGVKADIDSVRARFESFRAKMAAAKVQMDITFNPAQKTAVSNYREALNRLNKAQKDLLILEKQGVKTGSEYALAKAMEIQATNDLASREIALKNALGLTEKEYREAQWLTTYGITLDKAAALAKNEKAMAILREKAALDGLNKEQMEANMQNTAAQLLEGTDKVDDFGTSLTKLGDKLKNFNAKNFFGSMGTGLKNLGKGFVSAAKSMLKFLASCWPLLVALAALAAAIALLVWYIKKLKSQTPEAKLKRAEEAAAKAAEAAEQAAEAYEHLNSSLEELDDKYDGLKDLIKGTKEWNKAVKDINKSVVDLIQEYPELAQFYEADADGILRIKEGQESAVQAIISQKEQVANSAQAASVASNISVAKAQDDVAYKALSNEAKMGSQGWQTTGEVTGTLVGTGLGAWGGAALGAAIGSAFGGVGAIPGAVIGAILGIAGGIAGGVAGHAITNAALSGSRATDDRRTREVAVAMSSGDIKNASDKNEIADWLEEQYHLTASEAERQAAELANSSDELIRFGREIEETEATLNTYHQAMATAAAQIAGEGKSVEDRALINNFATDDYNKAFYDKALDQINNLSGDAYRQAAEKAAKEIYGDTATVDKNGKVTYGEGDNKQAIEKEEFIVQWAGAEANDDVTNALKQLPYAMEQLLKDESETSAKALRNVLQDKTGKTTTVKDLKELQKYQKDDAKTEAKLDSLWNQLTTAQKEAFGSRENFLNNFWASIESSKKESEYLAFAFNELGLSLPDWEMTLGSGVTIIDKLSQLAKTATEEEFQKIYSDIDQAFVQLSDDEELIFSSVLGSFDWTDASKWADFPQALKEAGLAIDQLGFDVYEFATQASKASNAILKFTAEETIKAAKNLSDLIDQINTDSSNRNVGKETYELLKAFNPSLADKFMATADGYYYLGQSMEDLRKEIQNNTKALLHEDEKMVQDKLNIVSGIHAAVEDADDKISGAKKYQEADAKYKEAQGVINEAAGIVTEYESRTNLDWALIENASNYGSIPGDGDPADYVGQYLGGLIYQGIVYGWNGLVQGAESVANASLKEIDQSQYNLAKSNTEVATQVQEDATKTKEQYSDYANYTDYTEITAETINSLSHAQLTDFFKSIINSGADLSVLGIEGLHNLTDFSQIDEKKMQLWGSQVFSLLSQEKYLTDLKNTPDPDAIGALAATYALDTVDNIKQGYSAKADYSEFNQSTPSGLSAEELKEYLQNKYDGLLVAQKEYEKNKKAYQGAAVLKASQYGVDESLISDFTQGLNTDAFWKALGFQEKFASIKKVDTISQSDEYEALWRQQQKITKATEARAEAEKLYNEYLEDSTKTIAETAQAQYAYIEALNQENTEQQTLIDDTKVDSKAIYDTLQSQLGSDIDLSDYLTFDETTGSVALTDKYDELTGTAKETFDSYYKVLSDNEKTIKSAEDAIESNTKAQKDVTKDAKSKTASFYNDIRDALVEERNKEIDALSQINESINEAQSALLDSMQKQIDEQRRARDNEKTEQSITDAEAKLAYLRQDTSGSNALEIAELEKSIAEQKEDYQDTLIDQALQDMQDANERAAEQRERQISIQEQQLEIYRNSSAIWTDVEALLATALTSGEDFKNTALGRLMASGDVATMNYLESDAWWTKFKESLVSYAIATGQLQPTTESTPESTPESVEVDIDSVNIDRSAIDWSQIKIPTQEEILSSIDWSGMLGGIDWSGFSFPKFATGGLADFTGPAWLDGTRAHPELILNQRDTANFIALKDILSEIMNRNANGLSTKSTAGDNYYEIEINVDSIEGDYDVEQIADKIRDMIYKDATYRNVNAVNQKK